jgi:hypothetical protein
MANNYRQFSFALKLANKKEAVWFQKLLEKASDTEDPESGGTMADFDWTVYGHVKPPEGTHQELQGPHVWFRDNGEYGNVDHIADLVQMYLKKFSPQGYFTMSWADTCSKHRLGEFGGGFAVVTAKEQHWMDENSLETKHAKTLTRRNLDQ